MLNLIKNYPFTSLLFVFGFLVGLLFLAFVDFSINYEPTDVSDNPINLFGDYFKNSLGILIKGLIFGLILGAVLGLAGFIIDFVRTEPELTPLNIAEKTYK